MGCHRREGCTDPAARNYDPDANKDCCCKYGSDGGGAGLLNGGLLFWTDDAALCSACGVITVSLSNGQYASISGYYDDEPTSCADVHGGTFYLSPGTYDYTCTSDSAACVLSGGTVTVYTYTCTTHRVQ